MSQNADIFERAREHIGPHVVHKMFMSTDSYTDKGEYFILSPLRADKSVGSFHINENTGVWFDHATNEGGDFIELVSKSRGISLVAAAEAIVNESGGYIITAAEREERDKKSADLPDPVIPIPDTKEIKNALLNRCNTEWTRDKWGKATSIYRYFNEKNQWVFVVVRFEKEQSGNNKKRKKNDILMYYGVDNKWRAKRHDSLKPFPVYGIEGLAGNNLPVLFVEGEKCKQAAAKALDGKFVVLSWLGGTANIDRTNWGRAKKVIGNRDVYIWPDTDSQMKKDLSDYLPRHQQPGMKAALFIKAQIPHAKILEVYRAHPIDENPDGWDVSDLVESGGDAAEFIEDYTPVSSIDVPIDPYSVYRAFIDYYYENDGLEQVNGGYWQYRTDLHYWQQILKTDLHNNLQRWLEDTGLQWLISSKTKATKFINEVKQYLDRHSLSHYVRNPFKDSALSPFLNLHNGALKIDDGNYEWYPRTRYDESFYKNKYPINCLDFDFVDYSNREFDPKKECPAFYYFVKSLIPVKEFAECEKESDREAVIDEALNFVAWIIAYALSPEKPNEYFFGIYGDQRTGKSFFLKIIKSIIGEEFCIERRIADLDNRFASSGFWGKKVYIEPDLKTRQQLPEDFIKAYAGQQTISVEEKNKPAVDGVKISIAMFFISNYEFHARGVEGLARRLVMVPYKNEIKQHDTKLLAKIEGEHPHGTESPEVIGHIFDERPAILELAIRAWKKFCTEDDYKVHLPLWAKREKENWIMDSNSVLKFLEETYYRQNVSESIRRSDLYEKYTEWSKEEGRKPLGKKNFYEEVRRDKKVREMKIGGYELFIIGEEEEIPF